MADYLTQNDQQIIAVLLQRLASDEFGPFIADAEDEEIINIATQIVTAINKAHST